jgi:enoyl-CoA hydratase
VNTLTYAVDGRAARITLNRPERANGTTLEMPRELADCVEQANLDPGVHAIALAGAGKGFCGGYKPVLCKVHGFCVAGGTDMALCSDLLVMADDARIGYPPARAWGVPTSALWASRVGDQRAKRLLFTGDLIDGRTALEWGLAVEAPPADELDERFEALLERVALTPVNQLVMMKLLVNQTLYSQGLHASQLLGVFFDGIARHTPEGHAFARRAAQAGFKQAVRDRDAPYER